MSDFISKILAVFPKEVKDNWILIIVFIAGMVFFYNYIMSKGKYGNERMHTNDESAYQKKRSSGPLPAEDIDAKGNERYSDVAGGQSGVQGMPQSCGKPGMQDPAELLPKDTNSQWAQLNPAGQGDLANINLLKAGYHIGIDTIGQSLRNANLQIRSEPPNPQVNVGPWNTSTITSDFLRPTLEIGQGSQ
jgi:hypothetical protein